ncbi:helix-turn-helix domain-containing protein [Rhodococcus sp. KB6]|uniref:helix-turn-helix domain-containing protein n=1 Tax=Rhodococcus sp. KB6 TaxID=1752066 RepID=UPI000A6378B4|nr:helix-turn-helix domain-containing protein [Rhodococcus sp. KB6]
MQTFELTLHNFWLSVRIAGYQGCMALLLDTSVLEPDQRADAFVDAMGRASVPCAIHLENPERVSARMNVWNLGAASLFRSESTGMRLTRTARHVRSASMPVLAIALQESGIGHLDQHDEQRRVPAGELLMTDLTSTYDFSWTGTGASQCLYVPMDRLGLPIDTVRDAATRPHHSNLYPVMIAHVRELFRSAALLETDPAAEQLGEASIELARALVASIAHANPDASAPRSALAMTSIRRYIREHLHDPALNPARIAHAHNISLRQLYKICSDNGFRIEQWIITQRLQKARDELARPATVDLPIATIAHRAGFVDAGHFSRRFRQAYGLSPTRWRQLRD